MPSRRAHSRSSVPTPLPGHRIVKGLKGYVQVPIHLKEGTSVHSPAQKESRPVPASSSKSVPSEKLPGIFMMARNGRVYKEGNRSFLLGPLHLDADTLSTAWKKAKMEGRFLTPADMLASMLKERATQREAEKAVAKKQFKAPSPVREAQSPRTMQDALTPIDLRVLEGVRRNISWTEIGRQLHESPGSAKSRYFSAIRRLREYDVPIDESFLRGIGGTVKKAPSTSSAGKQTIPPATERERKMANDQRILFNELYDPFKDVLSRKGIKKDRFMAVLARYAIAKEGRGISPPIWKESLRGDLRHIVKNL